MSLPRIIIVDDQYGGVRADGRNRVREDFCVTAGLRDVTGDARAEKQDNPVAEAVFCRGQVLEDGEVHNDLDGTLRAIRKGWANWPRWAMLFLDLHFKTGAVEADRGPRGEEDDRTPANYFGLTVLEHLWRDPQFLDLPVVILSSMEREDVEHRFSSGQKSVAEFMDKSALDQSGIQQALRNHGLIADDRIVGHSVALLRCLREARRRASVGNGNILLFGETGTGKELLAQYIHAQSPRAGRAYRTVYTQGVPEELVEDRLFGHNRGAYTGASSAVPGEAELANGGTLFIDEFGEIPASVQSKLLRLLDKDIRETQRLGSRQVRRVDLQVVLATNRMELLSAGDFRQDLLYRANADDPIFLPKLQDRPEDIPLLAVHFVRKYETQFRETLGPERREITPEAITALTSHPWPGNVRQLDHAIERAVYRWPKLRILSAAHLVLPTAPPETRQLTRTQADRPAVVRESPPPNELIELLDAVQFDPANPSSWAGLAPNLIRAFVRAYFKLLRAALQVTSRHTASNPEGEVKYHPSMKLMHGSRKVTALGAADEIKRVMRLDKEGEAELLSDSLLRAAYQRVLETRPAKEKRPREG